jgi:Mrp family chromosome partitioning ATPase
MLVSTPQQLSSLVVRKAANLLKRLDIPVLGVIENMSFFRCPDCGGKHDLFGPSHAAEIAEHSQVDICARLPLEPTIAELCDAGRVEDTHLEEIEKLAKLLISA